jgi:dihydrofolate reductase
MGKIILFNMMSVDGFFEGLNKEIDWHNVDGEFNEFAIDQLNSASVLIFGRVTYELMAGYWPSSGALSDDPVVAAKMNSIKKVVFSRTLNKADWKNTKLIKGDPVKECRLLKQKYEKDIFLFGSSNLASVLRNEGVIDQYRIMINPVLLGVGNVLFKPSMKRLNLKLVKTKTFNSGNVLLYYEPVK